MYTRSGHSTESCACACACRGYCSALQVGCRAGRGDSCTPIILANKTSGVELYMPAHYIFRVLELQKI